MKKFYFNSINSVKSGNSGSASASPKARKLRMESLENRHLLAVGAPFPDACVEPDVSASAFYATETVGSSTSGATAIDISSALAEDSTVPDFVDEFDSTSADDLIQFSEDSEPEDELIDESQTEEDLGPVQTVLTLMQYFNSLGIKDYSLDYPRDVFFYSSIDPECYLSTLDFSDESTLFIDLGARDDQVLNLERAFETIITRSGGGNEPEQPEDDPPVVGEITYSGSPFILEKNDGTINAPSDATYYIIHVPEVDYTYMAFLEFAPVVTATNPGAICGVDYKIAGTPATNGIYFPFFPTSPLPTGTNGLLEVSGGFDYCVVPINDEFAEDPEEFTISFFIEKVSGGGERYYGNTLTATILDNSRSVNVSWGDGNYNNQGATLSANPRGGGARVYPEQETESVYSLKNVVSLNFTLDEPAPTGGQTVYFKLMDPDNYISLGNGQSTETNSFTPNDNYQFYLRDAENLVLYVRNDVNSITIPAGESEYTIEVEIPEAYAGDNWIAFAGLSESAVSGSILGSSESNRYSIVRTNTNQQVSQSQMLTVWRTLWLELDQLMDATNSDGAGFTEIGSITVNAFEEACVSVKEFNQDENCITGVFEENHDYEWLGIFNENGIPELYYKAGPLEYNPTPCSTTIITNSKDIPSCTSVYWSIRSIGAFCDYRNNSCYGLAIGRLNSIYSNTLFVFNESLQNMITNNNPDGLASFIVSQQCTLTHEIGHFFALNHPGTGNSASVMSSYGENESLSVDLTPSRQHFSLLELATIQAQDRPQ